LGCACVLLAGCASKPAVGPVVRVDSTGAPSSAEYRNQYRIGPEDVLEVVVWKNVDLSKTVTVRPDGMITLPLIGELRAGGRTADEVREEIKSRLDRFKEVPQVSVTVVDVRSYNLYVLGEVRTPGRYQVKTFTSLLQALALAGGFTEFADPEKIVIVRSDGPTKQQRIKLRYKDLVRRGDVPLAPGDIVIVP
jgi:polysaccharide export outer membrane protein